MGTKLSRPEQMRHRTRQFALSILRMNRRLPITDEARLIGKQVLRSSMSIAANYRAVCRARSEAEFIAKLGIAVEETDETLFWLELLVEAGVIPLESVVSHIEEAKELLAILAASQITARKSRAPQ